ncbi:MAG: phage tail family protein [Clostridia bacterium]|nr:phage tail family protein [Clostridia bacterium]
MTQMIFQNERGKLCFSGGGKELLCITEISGLAMPPKSFETAVYVETPGQKTLSETREARVITVAGDICGKSMLSKTIRVLDAPGWLMIYGDGKTRKVYARCISFEQGKRYGQYYRFALQFSCDSPYFEEKDESKVALFLRTNELKTPFVLPCRFSSRTSSATVINRGDVEAEPVFEIYFMGDEEELWEVTIQNEQTGEKLALSIPADAGDCVTIDVAKRKIYNQKGENLLPVLSPDSFLSRFHLQRGANFISVTSQKADGINVLCRFVNRYLEAVC